MPPKKKIAKKPAKKPAKKKKTTVKKRASARKATTVDATTRAVQQASPLAGLKKPANAYFIFQKQHREEVKIRLGLGNSPSDWGTLSQELGRMYRELPEDIKKTYEKMAQEGVARHAFLKNLLDCGAIIPVDQVKPLLEQIRAESSAWGEERWNTIAVFLVLLARSPEASLKEFKGTAGLDLVSEVLSAGTRGLQGAEQSLDADAAADLTLTAFAVLTGLSLDKQTVLAHEGLTRAAKDLKRILGAGIADKVQEEALKESLQDLIQSWQNKVRAPPVPPSAFAKAAAPQRPTRASTGKAPPAPDFTANLRAKVAEVIAKPFGAGGAGLGAAIEDALFRRHAVEKDYRSAARTLSYNLGENEDLRERVRSGDVDAETLVGMDARELATKEVQEMRERVQQEAREAVTDKSGGGVLVWDKFSGTMKMRGNVDHAKQAAPRSPKIGELGSRTPRTLDQLMQRFSQKLNPADEPPSGDPSTAA
jgi:hypothetical protein